MDKKKYILGLGIVVAFALLVSVSYADKPMKCYYDKKEEVWICWMPEIISFGDLAKKLHILGTEYWSGEKGKVYLQLQYQGEPVENASCFITIFDPNANIIHESAPAMEVEEYGLYYYDFPTILQEGVYTIYAECSWELAEVYFPPTSYELIDGSLVAGTLEQLQAIDGNFMQIKESPTTDNLEIEFNFTLPSNLSGNYTTLTIYSHVKWDGTTDNVTFYIWNYNTSTWEELPNRILYSPYFVTVNNALFGNVTEKYLDDLTIRIKINSTLDDGDRNILDIDYLSIGLVQVVSQTIENIRGGGEVHIHNATTFSKVIMNESGEDLFWIFEKQKDLITETILSNHDYCWDNQTLAKSLTIQKCIGDKCYNYTKLELVHCEYGCSNDRCNPSPITSYAIVIGIIIAIFIALGLAYKFLS